MIDEKVPYAVKKKSTEIKTSNGVLDFFSESFDNYFSGLDLSFSYRENSTSEKNFKVIDKKYTALLVSQLAQISIFKLLAKKNYRNSRLMYLDHLIKDIEIELSLSHPQKVYTHTFSIHTLIFSLVHLDQPDILEFLFQFDFFKEYIKQLNPRYLINSKLDNIFTYAICQNSIQVINIFQKAGWKASVEDLKAAITHYAEPAIRHLFNNFNETEKEKIIDFTSSSTERLIILDFLSPKVLSQSLNRISAKFFKNPESAVNSAFLITSNLYRYTSNITHADKIIDQFKKILDNKFLYKKSILEEIKNKIDETRSHTLEWRSQLAPRRDPQTLDDFSAIYNNNSDEKEREYAIFKLQLAKNIVHQKYKEIKNTLSFPDSDCASPRKFYSFKDFIWIVSQELNKRNKIDAFAQERKHKKIGRFSGCETVVRFNRYTPGFPFIEAMLNTFSEDVIQTKNGYELLYKGEIISEVCINPIEQVDLTFLRNRDLPTEKIVQLIAIQKEIFAFEIKNVIHDKKPLMEKIASLLIQAKIFNSQEENIRLFTIAWLAIICKYYKLSISDYASMLKFFLKINEPEEKLKPAFNECRTIHSTQTGMACFHGQQSYESRKEEVEVLNTEIFEMDSKKVRENPEIFYAKIAEFKSLVGKLTLMKRGNGSALEIFLAVVNIFHKLPLSILKNIQLDLFNIIVSESIEKSLFLHLFHPETLDPEVQKYVAKSKKEVETQRLLKKFKLSDETGLPEEKLEPVKLSDIECIDNFLQQNLVPHDIVDKNGDNLLQWAFKKNCRDVVAHIRKKNITIFDFSEFEPDTKPVVTIHPSIILQYLLWNRPPPKPITKPPEKNLQSAGRLITKK